MLGILSKMMKLDDPVQAPITKEDQSVLNWKKMQKMVESWCKKEETRLTQDLLR